MPKFGNFSHGHELAFLHLRTDAVHIVDMRRVHTNNHNQEFAHPGDFPGAFDETFLFDTHMVAKGDAITMPDIFVVRDRATVQCVHAILLNGPFLGLHRRYYAIHEIPNVNCVLYDLEAPRDSPPMHTFSGSRGDAFLPAGEVLLYFHAVPGSFSLRDASEFAACIVYSMNTSTRVREVTSSSPFRRTSNIVTRTIVKAAMNTCV